MGQLTLACHLGYRSDTTCSMFVMSLLAGNITVNGVTQTPIILNADFAVQGIAGYVSTFTIAAVGQTGYTVSQVGNANTISATIPAPYVAGENRKMLSTNCDDADEANSFSTVCSYAKHMDSIGEKPFYIIKSDDPFYADRSIVDDTGFTGLVNTANGNPQDTLVEFDYAIVYLANMGLLGNPIDPITRTGHDPDRQWAFQNIPHLFMHGDHIFGDDMGYSTESKASIKWLTSIRLWDITFGSVLPPLLSGETDVTDHTFASHYSVTFGGQYKVQVLDRVTMGEGGSAGGSVAFGNDQIDDLLTDADTGAHWMLINVNPHTIRFLDVNNSGLSSGANEPLFNDRLTEYQRLYTANTGLQQRHITSGKKWMVNTPDHHNGQVLQHENTTGVVNESFVSVTNGTGFGAQNHGVGATLITGLIYDGTTALFLDPAYVNTRHIPRFTVFTLDDSNPLGTLQAELISSDHTILWSGIWTEGQAGNLPIRP